MNCYDCGACCVILNATRKDLLSPARKEWMRVRGAVENDTHIAFYMPCPRLKDNRCTDYKPRPMLCRAFQVGGEDCLACRALFTKVNPA